jgi:antitoxin component YwqK of YwqJK toxin-antitoxin module
MKNLFLSIAIVFLVLQANAQNIGQEGDTLMNYVDINGLKQGHWKKTYENGVLQYETYFVNGKPVGDFKRYDKSGNIYAHLVHDTVSEFARAQFFYRSGKIAATGNYIGKEKDSIWNYFDDNGILYLQESFKKGVKNGAFRKYTSEKVLI